MKVVDMGADDLEWLVKGAPPVSAAVAERGLQKARLKTTPSGRRPWRLRQWAAAAAAAAVVFGVTAALNHQEVQAVIREWILPVPGFGVNEVQPELWCSLYP